MTAPPDMLSRLSPADQRALVRILSQMFE